MTNITKNAFADSLKKLLSVKTLDKITVVELVEDCGVNRQTFYYHFQDIYDLLNWIFNQEAERTISEEINNKTWTRCLNTVFEYLLENKSFIINVYRSVGLESLQRYLKSTQRHDIVHIINEIDVSGKLSEEDKKFINNFYTDAIVGVFLDWINNGMKEDYHRITDKIARLVSGDIEKYIG